MSEWIVREGKRSGGMYPSKCYEKIQELVRCKDCIVFGTHGKNTDICPMWHNTHIDPYRDFCSRGERKESE